jgi:hypothetical protein
MGEQSFGTARADFFRVRRAMRARLRLRLISMSKPYRPSAANPWETGLGTATAAGVHHPRQRHGAADWTTGCEGMRGNGGHRTVADTVLHTGWLAHGRLSCQTQLSQQRTKQRISAQHIQFRIDLDHHHPLIARNPSLSEPSEGLAGITQPRVHPGHVISR